MRILYIDCDSLRPDHLGCYGYSRDTSPNIDRIATEGRRYTNYYASDVPCLPSRTAFFSGQFGIETGAVNHGGTNATPRPRGPKRGFNTSGGKYRSLPTVLRKEGHQTVLISSFPQRHGAWHVLDGFDGWIDVGMNGRERADTVTLHAREWLDTHATEEDWYLHVNFWDPHTPYDTPMTYGDPFERDSAPEWPDEQTISRQYESYGPHSAHEPHSWGRGTTLERPPLEIDSRDAVVRWVDGYDTGSRYMDDHLGELFDSLEQAGVFEDTLIIISADHGENLGELNVYGDHQTADEKTCNVPLVVKGPGVEPGVDHGLHYHVDLVPTLANIVGGDVPDGWSGRSFASSLTRGRDVGREFLVLSQGAWACQRGIRWGEYLVLRTYHDGLKDFEPAELYNITTDPHETENLAREHPSIVRHGISLLDQWRSDRLLHRARAAPGTAGGGAASVADPLMEVVQEGGPFHARSKRIQPYAERLRASDRDEHAQKLETYRGYVPQDIEAYLEGQNVWSK